MDPHDPYDPRGEFRKYEQGHPLDGRYPVEMLKRMMALPNRRGQSEHAVSYLVGLYDGDIRHNDVFFGGLLDSSANAACTTTRSSF